MIVALIVLALLGDSSTVAAAAPVTASASSADFAQPGVRLPPPPPVLVVPELTGAPVDLSTVMGKARKLANQWDQDAALLGIEAIIIAGLVPTADGGEAKLTFGPSPYDAAARKSGVFIVTYDNGGLVGTPAKAAPSKALPEPMCAPEAVYGKIAGGFKLFGVLGGRAV